MKLTNFFIICILFSSCQVRHNYTITGNVSGIPDSTIIDLFVEYPNMGKRIASDTIIDGKFHFSDSIGNEVQRMGLSMRNMRKYPSYCKLWVGRGDIRVTGAGKDLSTWIVKGDTKEQQEENNLLNHTRKYSVKLDSLISKQMKNYQNHIDDKGKIRKQINSIQQLLNEKELDYLKDNYNSKVAVIYLCWLAEYGDSLQKEKIRKFYRKIDTVYTNNLWGEGLRNYLNKVAPPKVGEKFVDFKAFDTDGKMHQLSDYQGKFILLDFWSMGCYPCMMSLPAERKLSKKYKDDLNIVSINLETKKKFWIETSKKDSITWTNLSDGQGTYGGAAYAYGVKGLPTYILINKEGKIAERWMGFWPGVFEKKLSKYLN